ncbi:GNAT family N-acetyltransferase [Planctomicrobium piriforme]|uniref:Acetyltransferase (GNAT) domain-containing protein n=1 Tax=Planctomicrobium piriforme TaxID=1576369 RepID=A0A1I3BGC5_9PLAN|nr:GNAT family N-acetyltransferase [Planctomicrobium piriforme]SFH61375.1 Acetyltransferase (GNAT) domain-containing protein [Planctomicrobium piriforme]
MKVQSGRLQPPRAIQADDDLAGFDSGEPVLDEWLRKQSLQNEASGASRTYVVLESGTQRVVAYYSLATGAVLRANSPGGVRRNMPEPIPVMVLGRLAVDQQWQGHGLGQGLLRDAILRTLQAAEIAGIRALLVHALSDAAKKFYEHCGFQTSPIDPLTLMLRLSAAARLLSGK